MEPGPVILGVAGATLLLLGSLVLRTRIPGPAVWATFVVGSVLCGIAMLVSLGSERWINWVVVLVGLGALGPIHFRTLLGPFGPPRPDSSATVVRS